MTLGTQWLGLRSLPGETVEQSPGGREARVSEWTGKSPNRYGDGKGLGAQSCCLGPQWGGGRPGNSHPRKERSRVHCHSLPAPDVKGVPSYGLRVLMLAQTTKHLPTSHLRLEKPSLCTSIKMSCIPRALVHVSLVLQEVASGYATTCLPSCPWSNTASHLDNLHPPPRQPPASTLAPWLSILQQTNHLVRSSPPHSPGLPITFRQSPHPDCFPPSSPITPSPPITLAALARL